MPFLKVKNWILLIRMGFLYDISGTLVNFYNGNEAEVYEFEHIQ